MRRLLIILILVAYQASATVEDIGVSPSPLSGTSPVSGISGVIGSVLPSPSAPSMPNYLTGICPRVSGYLLVAVDLTGPQTEQDKGYVTQGRPLEFMVTVKNEGPSEVEADLSISSENCPPEWFSWTNKVLAIPSGVSRSEKLLVQPDLNAIAGPYHFNVDASAKCYKSGSRRGSFTVQDYDYASETAISGTGQFQLTKDVSAMNSGIKSKKDIDFSGSVDALVKNEYLVEHAKGRNPNFEEQDKVDNYVGPGLIGTEDFKSSVVFGGVGAKVSESYAVTGMDYKDSDFNLHQTGSLKKMAEFKDAAGFNTSPLGWYSISAKQTKPGQRSLKEQETYFNGSFEINRRILFRDNPTFSTPCFEGDCTKQPLTPSQGFYSPCISSSCNNFVNRLNSFIRPA